MAIDLIRTIDEMESAVDFNELRAYANEAADHLEDAMETLRNVDAEAESSEIVSAIDDAINYIHSALNNIR